MRGTKWYKLNKSNESLQIFLNESFSKLEVTVGDKIADGVTRVGEVIFSAGIAFAIEQKYDPLDNVWKCFPFFHDEKLGYIRLTISSTVIFLAVMLISNMLIWALKKAKRTFRDNKATPKDAHALEQYFYKQVLNDIITGISLEKKADGLMKGHKFSATKVQDSSLYLIYMVESVFYFGEALKCIDELELFEIDNIRRKPYTDFLNSINQGFSRKAGTLRGLHFQEGEHAQAKLVSCMHGSIFNVAVDLRPGDTFGYAYSEILSFENQKQMLIPRGFAHGYLTLEDDTLMQWCVDNDFCGEAARAVRYDSDFIWQTEPWPMQEYILSEKDINAIKLSELRKF